MLDRVINQFLAQATISRARNRHTVASTVAYYTLSRPYRGPYPWPYRPYQGPYIRGPLVARLVVTPRGDRQTHRHHSSSLLPPPLICPILPHCLRDFRVQLPVLSHLPKDERALQFPVCRAQSRSADHTSSKTAARSDVTEQNMRTNMRVVRVVRVSISSVHPISFR
jgi:hypothetical protein